MEEYVNIGYTKKPFGITGELKVHIEEEYLEDFLQAKVFFLKMNGKPVPYFVEAIRVVNMLLLKLEEVDTKEAAAALGNTELMLRKKDIIPDEDRELEFVSEFQYAEYEGFMIRDALVGEIGIIEEVQEFPQQEMAIVHYQGKETLIPLNEDLIQSIDPENKVIWMDLPEGLLSL